MDFYGQTKVLKESFYSLLDNLVKGSQKLAIFIFQSQF